MYFRLNPECYFIRGTKQGAIFDLIDEKIYILDQQETDIITSCERNNPVEIPNKFLVKLKETCLGNFYPKKVYVPRLRVRPGTLKGDSNQGPLELHRVSLEINNLCNRDCWFCGYYGIKRNLGCMGCNKWKDDGKILSLERCLNVIDELSDLDCKNLYLTGGDLTLTWQRAMDILDYAKEKFEGIFITLHQQSISTNLLNDLTGKANVIIQADKFKNIPFKDATILLMTTHNDLEKNGTIEDENAIKSFAIGDHNLLPNDLPIISRSKVSPVDMRKFLNNIEHHPCLSHTLAICYNGNVIPCPMMRKHSLGNISDIGLSTIIEKNWESINNYWNLNLDKIEKCTCCEFRYTCSDCRALEEAITKRLDGKLLCNYNPNEAKWL